MSGLPPELYAALVTLVAEPRVVLGVDFDGTLAPFEADPARSRAVPGSQEALRAAAELPGVTVAVVSGRDLTTLRGLTSIAAAEPIVLIGSHGAESSVLLALDGTTTDGPPGPAALGPAERDRLQRLTTELERVASDHPPSRVESKPAAVALHTRGIDPAVAERAAAAARDLGARHVGVTVLLGKDVVELTVVEATKGAALRALAERCGATATAYAGDDVTDELAFAALDPEAGDVTIKVGPGETGARHRVAGIPDVLEVLQTFVRLRAHPA